MWEFLKGRIASHQNSVRSSKLYAHHIKSQFHIFSFQTLGVIFQHLRPLFKISSYQYKWLHNDFSVFPQYHRVLSTLVPSMHKWYWLVGLRIFSSILYRSPGLHNQISVHFLQRPDGWKSGRKICLTLLFGN